MGSMHQLEAARLGQCRSGVRAVQYEIYYVKLRLAADRPGGQFALLLLPLQHAPLQCKAEVWVLITQLLNTLLGLSGHRRARLLPLLILSFAPKPQNRRSQRSHARQSESSAETSLETRRLLEQEDVGAHERTSSTEIDNRCESDCALVSTSAIHRHPNNRDGHSEIATAGDEEHTHVSHLWVGRVGDFNRETRSKGKETHDVEVVTALQVLARVSEDD
jgi:hypothetical protein